MLSASPSDNFLPSCAYSLANSHKRAASPPVVLRASGVLEAGDPPAWKARHRSCLPTQRSQELVAFARSLPAAERRVLRAQLVLAEFADILRG